jgi:hypothetical protein
VDYSKVILLHFIPDNDKMKNKKYTTVRTVPKSTREIVERGESDNTQMHGQLLSWLGTGSSIKSDRVKLVLWAQPHTIK